MEQEIKPFIVALDTNVFISANFIYDRGDLYTLKQHVDNGTIGQLIISDVMARECKRHLEEDAEDLIKIANDKIFDTEQWRRMESVGKLKDIPRALDVETVKADLIGRFDKYLKDAKFKVVDSSGVDIKDILNDYFDGRPPFKSTRAQNKRDDRKKYEFPDAIAIDKLKRLAKEYGELRVVSEDPDWKAAFFGETNVKFYSSLKDLFAELTANLRLKDAAIQYFNERRIEFDIDLEEYLMLKQIEVDGQTWDRHGLCEGFDYDDVDIINIIVESNVRSVDYIGEKELKLTADATAEIEVEGTYFDEENSVWDPEDKEYYSKSYGRVRESHEIKFAVETTYLLSDGKIVKQINMDLRLPKKIYLDQDTRIDSFALPTDGLCEYKKQYKCACGHSFTLDLMDYTDDATNYERGMGVEIAHSVEYENECPHCKRKFKISGAIYEYPLGAVNLDDTKIEWR